jgi:dTDP-4-amino-4,6-dideoxygalactose transaminase
MRNACTDDEFGRGDDVTEPAHTNVRSRTVPFFRPDIGDQEIAAVVETLRSGWVTVGPRTQAFEEAFERYIGARHAVAVSSCTAALHLVLDALALQPGDEVITSTMTFTATAGAIIHAGGRPVLVDCAADTLNLEPAAVERRITPRTRAIVPVHFAGHPVPLDELLAVARARRVPVIEDAAHAFPARYRGRPIGTIGDATAFSFYATKNLCTGEGGMLTLADDEVAERLRSRRLHGMNRDAWRRFSGEGSWRYDVTYPGFKYNLTDTAAAMGLVQLQRTPELHRRRQGLAALYTDLLRDEPAVELPTTRPDVEHAWHLYVVRVRPARVSITRDALIEALKAAGVGAAVHYIPLHLHSYYRDTLGCRPADFPVASAAADTLLSLPFFTLMGDDDVRYVTDTLRGILERHRR